jgi:uncharacterized membrane protein
MSIKEMKTKALSSLKGNWPIMIIIMIIYGILMTVFPSLILLLIGGPLVCGLCMVIMQVVRTQKVNGVVDLFSGFYYFVQSFLMYLLMAIFIGIGLILFIIPGIIVAYGLSLAPYLLSDDPSKGAMNCIKESWALMKGNKWRKFVLDLSFIGWWILAMIPSIIILSVSGALSVNGPNVAQTVQNGSAVKPAVFNIISSFGAGAAAVIASIITLVLVEILLTYQRTTQGVFYDDVKGSAVQSAPASEV